MKHCNEADVIRHYLPRVIRLCKTRWPYMRMDEKVAEAEYFLFCTIRTPFIRDGQFWDTFLHSFIPYMNQYYRSESNRKFAFLSLDAKLNTKNPDGDWTLLDCLPAMPSFESTLIIDEFIASLPQPGRNILMELLDKTPRVQIMRRYGLTSSELKQVCQKLRKAYLAWAEADYA